VESGQLPQFRPVEFGLGGRTPADPDTQRLWPDGTVHRRGRDDRFPVDPGRDVWRVGIYHDLVGCQDGQAAPPRCRSVMLWQAARCLRVAPGSTGFIRIGWGISAALWSGAMRNRLQPGKRRRRKAWCCVYATGRAGETIVL
jgi:hypothetical protein